MMIETELYESKEIMERAIQLINLDKEYEMNPKMTLNDLLGLFHRIEYQIVENQGEITPELDMELKTITEKMTSKVDQISFIKERSKTSAAYYRQKAKDFQKLAQSMDAIDERLTEYVKFGMSQNNLDKLEGDDVVFKLSKRGQSLKIAEGVIDVNVLPDQLCIISRELNKTAIKELLLTGVKLAGAELKDTLVLTQSMKRKEIK